MYIILIIILALFALSFTRFEIRREVEIKATPEMVWHTIIGFPDYKYWNTQLFYLGGEVKKRGRLHLKLSASGTKPYEFKPVISHWEENEKFAWLAVTGLPKIFDGEHFFEIKVMENNTTLLINREVYRGILSLLIKNLPMMKDAPKGFEQMNEEIKKRAENFEKNYQ